MRAFLQVSPPPAPLPPQIRPAPPPQQKRAFKCVPILLWVWFLKVDPVLTRSPDASGWAGRAGPGPPPPPGPKRGGGRLGRTVPWCRARAVRGGGRGEEGGSRGPGTRGGCGPGCTGGRCTAPLGRTEAVASRAAGTALRRRRPLSVRLPRQEMSSYWKDSRCLLPRVVESETNSRSPGRQKTLCSSWGGVLSERAFEKSHLSGPSF